MTKSSPLIAGLIGAAALTTLHETTRRFVPDAPRMDKLGERGLTKLLHAAHLPVPADPALHRITLAGDILSNGLFYALAGHGKGAAKRGALLGLLAGLGAVILPPYLGLGKKDRGLTPRTKAMTVAYYLSAGLVAGAVAEIL